jgi:hypothetical protein
MSITPTRLKEMIEAELAKLKDERVLAHIPPLLIEPAVVKRNWDYGEPGQQFPCWTVLEHTPSNTGVAYAKAGLDRKCRGVWFA